MNLPTQVPPQPNMNLLSRLTSSAYIPAPTQQQQQHQTTYPKPYLASNALQSMLNRQQAELDQIRAMIPQQQNYEAQQYSESLKQYHQLLLPSSSNMLATAAPAQPKPASASTAVAAVDTTTPHHQPGQRTAARGSQPTKIVANPELPERLINITSQVVRMFADGTHQIKTTHEEAMRKYDAMLKEHLNAFQNMRVTCQGCGQQFRINGAAPNTQIPHSAFPTAHVTTLAHVTTPTLSHPTPATPQQQQQQQSARGSSRNGVPAAAAAAAAAAVAASAATAARAQAYTSLNLADVTSSEATPITQTTTPSASQLIQTSTSNAPPTIPQHGSHCQETQGLRRQ